MSKRNRRTTRGAVVLVCMALVASACSRGDSGSKGSDGATTSSSTSTSKSGPAAFGDLTNVCQGGSPSGSPTTGVTPDSIRVATFSDVGFAGRPGLNQEFFDTADVFADWCNAAGGINGRKIVVDKRDAALTNVTARMAESCADNFAMVGGGATFDQDGVEPRLKCLLPDVAGFAASVKARGADLLVQPEPNALDQLAGREPALPRQEVPGRDAAHRRADGRHPAHQGGGGPERRRGAVLRMEGRRTTTCTRRRA